MTAPLARPAPSRLNLRDIGGLLLSVVICLSAGVIGSAPTMDDVNGWYTTIEKPFFTPPSWLFGPAWTVLYVLMGIAFWRVWRLAPAGEARNRALLLFGVQLVLNALWSLIFFQWRQPLLALVEIVALWIAIALTIRAFRPLDRAAAWLLAPYLAWVTFATALNAGMVVLNR